MCTLTGPLRVCAVALGASAMLLALFPLAGGFSRAGDEPQPAAHLPPQLGPVLDSVVRGDPVRSSSWTQQDTRRLVSELATTAEVRYSEDADLAVRALGQLGPAAAAAVPTLCRRLYLERHASRDWAIKALVAIGEPAVRSLEQVSKSASSSARAAAVEALIQLDHLEQTDFHRLSVDSDPRVRVAVATKMGMGGAADVRVLVKLCDDPEPAVAVAAIASLGHNHSDVQFAVPALTELLARRDFESDVVVALSHYGVEARRAIPDLLRLFARGDVNWYLYPEFTEDEDSILRRIGPPAAEDSASVLSYVKHSNEEIQMLAATCLSRMEQIRDDRAGDTIEEAIAATVSRYQQMVKSPKEHDSPGRVFMANEFLVGTLWQTTQDTSRVCRVLKKIAQDLGEPAFLSPRPDGGQLTDPERRLAKQMLESGDRSLQLIGLDRVSYFKSVDEWIIDAALRFAESNDNELAKYAVDTLRVIGAPVGERAAPALIRQYRGRRMSLDSFAQAVSELQIRSAECREILQAALPSAESHEAVECARTLAEMSDDPIRCGQETIDLVRRNIIPPEDALEILQTLTAWSEKTRKYVLLKVGNLDHWTNRNAIVALGVIDADSGNDAAPLLPLLSHDDPEIRLVTAQAIYRITGATEPLRTLLTKDEAFVGPDARYRHSVLAVLGELKEHVTPFLDLVPLQSEDSYFDWDAVAILTAAGTPEAARLLEQLAQSPNWGLRRRATAGLREFQNHQKKQ